MNDWIGNYNLYVNLYECTTHEWMIKQQKIMAKKNERNEQRVKKEYVVDSRNIQTHQNWLVYTNEAKDGGKKRVHISSLQ